MPSRLSSSSVVVGDDGNIVVLDDTHLLRIELEGGRSNTTASNSSNSNASLHHHGNIMMQFPIGSQHTSPGKRPLPRNHVCSFCLKTFCKSEDLKRHIRVHTGERPYCCTSCPYRSALKGNLKQHLKVHEKHSIL